MSAYVEIGPAAFRVGRYWMGVASGNRPTGIKRRTVARAIADAQKIETRLSRKEGP